MPIDSEGNRAMIVMDPNGTINRANPGRLYELYYNSSARDTHKRLCNKLGIKPFTKEYQANKHISTLSKEVVEDAFNYLYNFYKIISPQMASWFDNGQINNTHEGYLSEIVERGIGVYLPTDNQPLSPDIVKQLELHYTPTYGVVSYVGNSGKKVTTKNKVRIGSIYIILLEKTASADWSSVSSSKLQHHGVLSQLTRNDKYAKPARNQAVRGAGEAEIRIFVSYIGPKFVAEMLDRNNNPNTHKTIVEQLLSSPAPSNINSLIDRRTTPYGGNKPLLLLKHLVQCSGFVFVNKPYKNINTKFKGVDTCCV